MSPLINCEALAKSHGSHDLFHDLALTIFKGDRIGLIGPNGAGKSTLLKILAGIESPDSGTVACQRNLRVGYVPQESVFLPKTVREIVIDAAATVPRYDEHEREVQSDIILGKVGFENPDQLVESLSGGWKKRLEIARQLVAAPDLLLLDEPTNHLDLGGILWLEKFLLRQPLTYLVISHDRYFLENVTTRVMEINGAYPKGIFASDGTYSTFLERREMFLAGQIEMQKSLNSKVRREIEWLKQNPKARTTKSRSRIQEAERLQEELAEVKGRNQQVSTTLDFSSTARETKKLLTAKNISTSMGCRCLFSGIDLTLTPGLRLGVIGANGSGKTTLLKILAGDVAPDTGTVKIADGIKILLFDQHREELAQDLTLRRALAPEGDRITYRGQSIHVNGWCRRFLFSPDRLDLPVSRLSGGERARVLMARMMAQPADILLLDEPTNDLDIATLETLEESLQDFPGAIVMITHDRYILEETCNLLLGIGPGGKTALLADYSQWETVLQQGQPSKAKSSDSDSRSSSAAPKKQKLSHQEKKDLEQMEAKILKTEEQVSLYEKKLQDPVIASNPEKLQEHCQQLQKVQHELETLYARWQEIEDKQRNLQ